MNRSMPGLPVHHQLPEFTQTHVYRVHDAIQPSHPLSSKRRIPLAVVLPRPARAAGTLIPSAQRLDWAAKQALRKAALGALFA